MISFEHHSPTKIIFGTGSSSQISDVVRSFGSRIVLVVGRDHAKSTGLADQITHNLTKSGCKLMLTGEIGPNTHLPDLLGISERLGSQSVDCILAVGGGSVMDASKLLSISLTHPHPLWDYRVNGIRGMSAIDNCLVPIITLPTTAGTGSEISSAALATYEFKKELFLSQYMRPQVAILDPELTLSLPRNLMVQIALDAFVQSLEAFMSAKSQLFSDMFAIQSMQLIYNILPRAIENIGNIEYRGSLLLAGIFSAYAMGQAGVGAIHALSDPLSGKYNIGHGLAVSMLLPVLLKQYIISNLSRFAALAKILNPSLSGANEEEAAEIALNLIDAFLDTVEVTKYTLSSFGIQENDLPLLVKDINNPDMVNSPGELSEQDCINIYKQIL